MGASTSASTLFTADTVKEIFNKVKGHSSIAMLSGQVPVSFAGNDYFTFSLDSEVSLVGEAGEKPAGNATVGVVTMKPLKVVYQHRVSDEFMKTSDEKALSFLEAFQEGFARKIATGLDIMAFHGFNPATLSAAAAIGNNHLDYSSAIDISDYSNDPESALNAAVAALGEYEPTGYALSKAFAALLGNVKVNGVPQYPEFKLGGNPGKLAGHACDVNSTVNKGAATIYAYVGDFANAFRWGYAENIPLEVIQYGNPDGQGDLKRMNQVVLRAEAYIGWAVLDPAAFKKITT